MAVANAICKCAICGQEFTYRKNGFAKRRDADSFEEWAKEHITECYDCRQKRKRAEFDAANRKAASDAKKAGLIVLEGSQKQIDWAESIRMRAYEILHNLKEIVKESQIDRFSNFIDWCLGHAKASWWIDHRDDFREGVSLRNSAVYIQPVLREWEEEK